MPQEGNLLPTKEESSWAPHLVWRTEISSVLPQYETLDSPVDGLVTIPTIKSQLMAMLYSMFCVVLDDKIILI
jgi:hypothetical protein